MGLFHAMLMSSSTLRNQPQGHYKIISVVIPKQQKRIVFNAMDKMDRAESMINSGLHRGIELYKKHSIIKYTWNTERYSTRWQSKDRTKTTTRQRCSRYEKDTDNNNNIKI